MIIRIDADSTVPPYDQIREQIETMAISGVLQPGDRLPSIRQLAADLGLAPATVARAFTALETAGIVASRRGRGTSVIGAGRRTSQKRTASELARAADAFARRVHQLGVHPDAALAAAAESIRGLPRA